MSWRANYGSGDEDGPEFICCVDVRQPQIYEIWTFGEDGVTREVHPTAQVDISAGLFGEFATDYITPSWRRFPTFGRNSINGSVEWLEVPDFLRTDVPLWNANILDPHHIWGDQGYITNTNWSCCYGVHSNGVSVPWNRPMCVLPVYHRRIFENMRSDLLQENRTYRMQSPSTCHNPTCGCMVNRRGDERDNLWDEPVDQ